MTTSKRGRVVGPPFDSWRLRILQESRSEGAKRLRLGPDSIAARAAQRGLSGPQPQLLRALDRSASTIGAGRGRAPLESTTWEFWSAADPC
jgi:hypothetical protein